MKTICVPINEEAQVLLDYDKCPDELLLEINLSQEEFDFLWRAKFFDVLNSTCNVLIDDYEDEKITDTASIELALNKIKEREWPKESLDLVERVTKLFVKANEFKTGVHFFF